MTERLSRETPRRRFTLRDMLILVAAFGLGAAIHREMFPLSLLGILSFPTHFKSLESLIELIRRLNLIVPPWLFSASLALFAIRLLPPRPKFHRLLRQPGAVASLAVVAMSAAGLILSALAALIVLFVIGRTLNELNYESWIYINCLYYGPSVAVAWLFQALGKRWCAEREWVDRCGRVVGGAWVVWFLVNWWSLLVT